jgi:hypothetical protein
MTTTVPTETPTPSTKRCRSSGRMPPGSWAQAPEPDPRHWPPPPSANPLRRESSAQRVATDSSSELIALACASVRE